MLNMEDALQTFILESRDLLQDMEDKLLHINQLNGEDFTEAVNAIFRAAHTIKGSDGLFGLDNIVGFTHVLETVLDRVRGSELAINDVLVSLFLQCKDHVSLMISTLAGEEEVTTEKLQQEGGALLLKLAPFEAANASEIAESSQQIRAGNIVPNASSSHGKVEILDHGVVVDSDNWHISLRFGLDVLRNGMDPLSFFRYLGTMGTIVNVKTSFENMPAAAEMDPESCYMAYEISFKSNADKTTIESVFEFVQDDCDINIMPPHSLVADFVDFIAKMPKEEQRIGQMLVRWTSSTLGKVPPSTFIPLAEESSLIDSISDWVLETICAQIRSWKDQDLEVGKISLNLSGHQFRQPGLMRQIALGLQKYGVTPEEIDLEITEGILMDNVDRAIRLLDEAREIGFSVSLDDFGTGYSSLSYLKHFPINTLKIDKSFIDGLPNNPSDMAIAHTIIALAHNLGMEVIAEGVEHRQQFEFY